MPDLMYLELKSGYNDNGPASVSYTHLTLPTTRRV